MEIIGSLYFALAILNWMSTGKFGYFVVAFDTLNQGMIKLLIFSKTFLAMLPYYLESDYHKLMRITFLSLILLYL